MAYDELSAELATAQAQAEKAAAAAVAQLQLLQEEAAAERQALGARVATLEHEQVSRWETSLKRRFCALSRQVNESVTTQTIAAD